MSNLKYNNFTILITLYMLVKFLLFLIHVLNSECSENDGTITFYTYNIYKIINGKLSINYKITNFLNYSNVEKKWNFKDGSINSFVVYFFLFPGEFNLSMNLYESFSDVPNSFTKYLIAKSYQSNENMWIKDSDTLVIKDQGSGLKTIKTKLETFEFNAVTCITTKFNLRELKNQDYLKDRVNLVIYVGRENFNIDKITLNEFSNACIFIGSAHKLLDSFEIKPNDEETTHAENIYNESSFWKAKNTGYALVLGVFFMVAISFIIFYYLRLRKNKRGDEKFAEDEVRSEAEDKMEGFMEDKTKGFIEDRED